MAEPMPYRKRPCDECPWRKDTPPGQFPADRYEALANTSGGPGREAMLGQPMFGCHKGAEDGRDAACSGWLAAVGYYHLTVRLAVAHGRLPESALTPGVDWPELYGSYDEMPRAQGG
jgi:hypothetical protein